MFRLILWDDHASTEKDVGILGITKYMAHTSNTRNILIVCINWYILQKLTE